MDQRFHQGSSLKFLLNLKNKALTASLFLPILNFGCTTDNTPSIEEATQEKAVASPVQNSQNVTGGQIGTIAKPEIGPKTSFWNRSIDEVIDSVNNADADNKLRDDSSLSNELQSGRIPLEINAAVQKWIEYFTGRDRERFQRFINRGELYRPMIMAVLKDQGIPPELYFLAMIESGFAVHATSHAQAVGVWQFIRPTGRRYGLKVTPSLDERKDPVRATIAASLYLRDLYNVFQSWYLAMAAYNAGEGRILQAIMKAKSRDFWEIATRGYLPSETMNYIPKFLAAAIIGHHPEKYGFKTPPNYGGLRLSSVFVPPGRSLAAFADAAGVPLSTLKERNPHLIRGVVPYDKEPYRLWIPAEYATKMQSVDLSKIPRLAFSSLAEEEGLSQNSAKKGGSRQTKSDVVRYKVKPGDNLHELARKFGTSIHELKKANRLKHHKIYAGQTLRITPKG